MTTRWLHCRECPEQHLHPEMSGAGLNLCDPQASSSSNTWILPMTPCLHYVSAQKSPVRFSMSFLLRKNNTELSFLNKSIATATHESLTAPSPCRRHSTLPGLASSVPRCPAPAALSWWPAAPLCPPPATLTPGTCLWCLSFPIACPHPCDPATPAPRSPLRQIYVALPSICISGPPRSGTRIYL